MRGERGKEGVRQEGCALSDYATLAVVDDVQLYNYGVHIFMHGRAGQTLTPGMSEGIDTVVVFDPGPLGTGHFMPIWGRNSQI